MPFREYEPIYKIFRKNGRLIVISDVTSWINQKDNYVDCANK